MGDIKKQRKKYQTPLHPWRRDRLEKEKILEVSYGTKNKTELYRMDSELRGFKKQIKNLVSSTSAQAEKEKQQLFQKLVKLGLVGADQTNSDAVLGLDTKDIMDRRLQTVVVKKGLAKTLKQSRQMITHGHITVNNKKITSPGYLVPVEQESKIGFALRSSFFPEDHPERIVKQSKRHKQKEVITKKEVIIDKDLAIPATLEKEDILKKEIELAIEEEVKIEEVLEVAKK